MAILFLKAAVRGHMRGRSFVRPYVTTRHPAQPDFFEPAPPLVAPAAPPASGSHPDLYRAAARRIQGRLVRFPDAAHAMLNDVGVALRHGEQPDPKQVDTLFRHFYGLVTSEPTDGIYFHAPEHVADLALDYTDPEMADMWGLDTDEAQTVVGAGGHAYYWMRGARLLRGEPLAKALAIRAAACR